MLEEYLDKIESTENSTFTDYYDLLFEGIKYLSNNDMHFFVYRLLNSVKDLGYSKAEKDIKKSIVDFINDAD